MYQFALKQLGDIADRAAGRQLREAFMRCSRCPNPEVVELRLRVAERAVTLFRCTKCDAKVWGGDEGTVSLERVLDLARAAR